MVWSFCGSALPKNHGLQCVTLINHIDCWYSGLCSKITSMPNKLVCLSHCVKALKIIRKTRLYVTRHKRVDPEALRYTHHFIPVSRPSIGTFCKSNYLCEFVGIGLEVVHVIGAIPPVAQLSEI